MVEIKGGDKLAARLAELSQNVQKAAKVEIGFLEGATYPDGTPVALVAAVNEFGRPGINPPQPPRPYFRSMIAEKSGQWPDTVGNLLKANEYDAEKTLGLMGDGIKGQLQQSITTFEGAALRPTTIARKGSEKQLVDSGHMLASVDYKVE